MSRSLISFTIPGKPKALKRHRVSKNGGMYDPSSTDKKQTWLQIAKHKPKLPIKGAIEMFLYFAMPRPKSHYRTGKFAGLLKDTAPDRHISKPDTDNLVKYVLDVLEKGFFCNDSQVYSITAIKEYGEEPSTHIRIKEIL